MPVHFSSTLSSVRGDDDPFSCRKTRPGTIKSSIKIMILGTLKRFPAFSARCSVLVCNLNLAPPFLAKYLSRFDLPRISGIFIDIESGYG